MFRKVSLTLSLLFFVCVAMPLDNSFFGVVMQPGPALAQDGPGLEDFALYSHQDLKLDHIGASRGSVGSNGSIDIKKGASGYVIGSFQALEHLKNEAEIGIYGDVTAGIIEDKGVLSVSGQIRESGDLISLPLPVLTYTAAGSDLEVPEGTSMTLAPDSYGRLKLKKGAALNLSAGQYHFVKFEMDESAAVMLDAGGGALVINVVEKIKFKKDVELQIVDGSLEDIHLNYKGSDKIEVGDHAVVRGILTAPSARIEFKKGSRLEGAAYAGSIHLAKGASFRHYTASPDGRPPTAAAGGYQTALAGTRVALNGSGSSDPDGDAITYRWSFVSYPEGSSPVLSDPTDAMPTFTADLVGVYVVELSVHDGTWASLRDTATVTVVSEVLDVTDFVLYADDKLKLDQIAGGTGHLGANRHLHVAKGPSGSIAGDLRVSDHIKSDGEITIDGDVITRALDVDRGVFTVTGTIIDTAQLAAQALPALSFSAEGPDHKVPESATQTLAPGSYGRVEVKKGAMLQFAAGIYYLRELKADDAANLIFEASAGAIELNVVKKLEFGKNSAVQITGGDTRDVRINYAGKKEVDIENGAGLRGTLVAPGAKVEFEKDSRLEGAVYAKKIYLGHGVSFSYHENRPPVADPRAVSIAEDTPASITLGGSDPDDDALTYKLISQPLHGILAGTAPDLIYTPAENFAGTDEFSYTVSDGTVDAAAALVNITVTAVNDAPVANPQNISLNEDVSQALVLTAFDVEDAPLAYEIVAHPAHGSLAGAAPELIYTPAENYHGSDSFSFKASDGNLDSNIAVVGLTIHPVNDVPTARAGSDQQVFREDAVSLDGSGSIDVDGDTLAYRWSFTSFPAGSTVALSDPAATGPSFVPDIAGTYVVQLIVNDGTVDSAPDAATISANPRMVIVPDLVGLIRADAMSALAGANLTAGTISDTHSDTIPADHVISHSPVAAASVQETSAVDLVVSLGPESQVPTVSINASPAFIYQGESATLSWTAAHAAGVHIDHGIGSVNPSDTAIVSPEHTTVYTITAIGPDGIASARVTIEVQGDPSPQPEASFGERYEDLIPADATIDSYDPRRFSLINGQIEDLSGSPVADVAVSIHSYPEYGTVASDAAGRFSIPVEGGVTLTVVYRKPDLITAHRKVYVPWNDIAIVATIQMIAEDPVATTLTFDGNPATVVTHESSPVTDEFGSRSATLVFTGDNRAYLMDENGQDVRELSTITTRATEFTTPESMPAELPPNSAFTYCVELSVDGAQRVRFDKPVIGWVDNFLGFDVGMAVPVGYYDRDQGHWLPADNGTVVRLLDTDADGITDALDADGDDQPDDLNGNGSFSDEILGLSDVQRYTPGSTFWRIAVSHFTPWDCNWPFGPPKDSTTVNAKGESSHDGKCQGDCPVTVASYVEARSRIFHEDIAIPGTNITLHYASDRVNGYRHVISVPASGDEVPASLKHIITRVEVAGWTLEQILDPLPGQMAEFIWDGLDYLGQPVLEPATAFVSIGFVYDAVYYEPADFFQAFARVGTDVTNVRARQEVISWKRNRITIAHKARGKRALAEGWTISNNHHIAPSQSWMLFKGDGETKSKDLPHMTTIAGNGGFGYSGDNGPASAAKLSYPAGVAADGEGNLYIADWNNNCVRKVDAGGVITTVAGSGPGARGYGGDGGPATAARLNLPYGVAVDGTGNIFIVDANNHRIRKVDTSGIITTVAGTGEVGFSGDGGPATAARLNNPSRVALDDAGNLYIVDRSNRRIRKVDTNGIIDTVAGSGSGGSGDTGDGGPAVEAQLGSPSGIAVDGAGNIYFSDTANNKVRKVDTTGIITTAAGTGANQYSGDGGLATDAGLYAPYGVAVDAVGNLYIADSFNRRIRKVDTSGVITTVAGDGDSGYGGDGGLATTARISNPYGVAVDAGGNVYIADYFNHRIRKVARPSAAIAQVAPDEIPFAEGSGVGHIFSSTGVHKRTIDLETGLTLRSFNYVENDRLESIIDRFANTISIERDVAGVPTAIISPEGIRTELIIDADNHLTRVTYPDGSYYSFEYSPDGLMTAEIEPAGNRFDHDFSATGQLTDAYDEQGGHWNYERMASVDGDILTMQTTGEGNVTTYLDRTDSTGAYTSTITGPAGSQTFYTRSADGMTVNKSADCGMDLEFEYEEDSEYKYQFLKQITETSPSGLARVSNADKTYQDTDADDNPELITETIALNGKTTTLEHYIPAAEKIATSPEGRTVTSFYDPDTLLTESVIIPGLYDTSYEYDANGRLTLISTHTRQTALAYNPEGWLESVTDAENRTTGYSYDAMGRVTEISRPDGSYIDFDYDANGNMTLLTNPGGIEHGFGFNSVNRNNSYQTPLSGSYSYFYDKDRRLLQTNFPSGKTIVNDYADPANPADQSRLWQIVTPEGNIDFNYLCGSQVESISKGSESIAYSYDGDLVTSETISGTLNESLDYTYNNDFNVAELAYAGDTVSYSYDDDGLLTGAGSFTIWRNFDNGLAESVTGSSLNLARTFNGYGEVDDQSITVNSQNVSTWSLIRDNNGRIASKTEIVNGVTSGYEYAYDEVGRLLTVVKDGSLVEEYRYDFNGTRNYEMNALRGISSRSYSYSDEDHLLSAGSVSYDYDLDGFLTTKTNGSELTSYTYSSRGELLNVVLSDGTVVEYVNDPLGRRIAKKVDGTITEKYLWQGLTRLLAVYDGSDNLLMHFEYADSRMPLAMTSGGSTYYLTYDQVGSLKLVADSAGNVIKSVDYDSFGNIIVDSNPVFTVPFGFAGGLHDRDTMLVRFGYRDYEPGVGRWTAKDPIFFAGGDTDLYGYVLNNPVNWVDPFGLEYSRYNITPYDIDYGGGSGGFSPPSQPHNPDHDMIEKTFDYGKGYAGGVKDFIGNYKDMRDANTIGADKYFHCMANCQAARRGLGGRDASIDISETREWVDENIKGDPASACNADRAANSQGRNSNPNQSCKSACSSLRPPGLSLRY